MVNYKKNLLILGHSGYIGNRLYNAFYDKYTNINLVGKSFPEIDLTKKDDVESLSKHFTSDTFIIMCSGIKKQHGDTQNIFRENMAMIENVCQLMKKRPIKRFIYFSSAEVYGEAVHNININENTSVQPSSYYGIAKYASEGLLKKVIENNTKCSLLILRPALVYGPEEGKSFYGPYGFLKSAINKDVITLWGNGGELREFLFVDDLVEVVTRLIFHEFSGLINIVNGRSKTFKDIIKIISELVPSIKVNSRSRSKPKVDQAYDNELLRSLLPDISFTSLEDGIRIIYENETHKDFKN